MSTPGRSPRGNHPYQNYSWVQLHEVIVDKDYQLECLRDELHKLGNVESESRRKDEVIAVIRRELAEYKKTVQTHDARNVTIDEQLTQCESLLQQRTRELEKLQSEMEDKFQSMSTKSSMAQKELQRLKETNALLEVEAKELRYNRDQDRDTITLLQKQLAEKKNRTGSLQDKSKKLHTNNQDLQTTLALLQSDHGKLLESELQLKTEVRRLKSLNSGGLLVQQKCDFMEKELARAKKNENEMATTIGKLESELCQLCDHIASCTQSHAIGSSTSPKVAVDLVSKMASDYTEARDMVASLEQEQEEDQETLSKLQADIVYLHQLWKNLQEELGSDNGGALDLLCSKLEESQSLDDSVNELYVTMKSSIKVLSNLEERCKKEFNSITDHIKDCYRELHDPPQAEAVADMVTNMAAAIKSSEQEIQRLTDKNVESELEHSASLSGAITALRYDEQQRIAEVADKVKQDEEVKKNTELQRQMEALDLQKEEAVSKEREVVESSAIELELVKNALELERSGKESLVSELTDMKTKLCEHETNNSKALLEVEKERKSTESRLTGEMNAHKEQAQQHAITIVSLEKKLLSLMEGSKTLEAENAAIMKRLGEKTRVYEAQLKEQSDALKSSSELTKSLKNQLTMVCGDNSSKDKDLKQRSETIAKMQKAMTEKKEELKLKHSKEVSDLQVTMAKQEAMIEGKTDEIDILTMHLSERVTQMDKMKTELTNTKEELHSIQRRIAEGSELAAKPSQLTEAGHICLKEKHGGIIENQKTALTQLRQKVSDLELAKPPIGSHQATLKELSRVRHEFAKLKANGTVSISQSSKKKPEEAVKFIPQFISESIEESKVREALLRKLEDTLQYSEKMYGALVEAICQGLPDFARSSIETGHFTATDDPSRKKEVIKARKKFADAVLKRLQSQGVHELDNDKEDRTKRSAEEIITDLEATLNETAEELEQQKRLNQALLRRKTFRESQQLTYSQRPKHSCKATLD